ncbi:MAG: type II toxin-antitoxin system VapC family toxin [Phycisphaeraceae bacterium]
MPLLLDTHTFLWFGLDNPSLSRRAKDAIETSAEPVLFSAASHWEIAIKASIGKLQLTEPFEVLIPRAISASHFRILPIELAHTTALIAMPHHHRDPFDRILIAQAIVEKLTIVTADAFFARYGVTCLW